MNARPRLIHFAIPCLCLVWSPAAQSQEKVSGDFSKVAIPFLSKHCVQCHGPEKKKAELAFHIYKDEKSLLKDRKIWQGVFNMVHSGEMPPPERPRPNTAEADAFLGVIQDIFARADKLAKCDPGRVTMRRLNRVEYHNTVRDLLGVDFDANELPQDDVGYGFDNIGDVLTISPFLMERYLAAAESVVQRAFPLESPKVPTRHVDSRFLEPAVRPDSIGSSRAVYSGNLHSLYKVNQKGEFKLRVRCFARPLGNEPVRIALELDGKELKKIDVKAVEGKAEIYETILPLQRGEFRCSVRFLNPYSEKVKDKAKETQKKRALHVHWLELVGPMDSRPESQQMLMAAAAPGLDKKRKTQAILTRFASRAYRRPATEAEVGRLVKIVETVEKRGEKWESGLQLRAPGGALLAQVPLSRGTGSSTR